VAKGSVKRRPRKNPAAEFEKQAASAWDECGPPIKYEQLIPLWQRFLVRFCKRARQYASAEETWNTMTVQWATMPKPYHDALNELWRRFSGAA
jgi:hypothetical protein